MPLNEQVLIDIQAALRQIDELERRLQVLSQPVDIPVDVNIPEGATARLRSDLAQAEGATEDLNRELRITERELDDVGDEAGITGRELEQAGKKGESAFRGLAGSLTAVGAGVLAARGLRALAGFLGESVQAASDLEQSIGGVESVFGEAADEIFRFGQTTAESVGLARSEAFQLSSLIGSQLQTFGFGAAEAAAETQNLIALSADLAATFGGPVSDAVAAVSSLLRGETNPIERYAVAMNQTLIQAHALEIGLIDTNRQLTLQERAVAALDLLYEQTANAQGQFARESDTTAGLMERLSAAFKDAQAEVGEALVPAFNSLLEALPGVIDGIRGLVPVIEAVVEVAGPFGLKFAELTGVITEDERVLRTWSAMAGVSADSAVALAGTLERSNEQFQQLSRRVPGVDALQLFEDRLRGLLDLGITAPTELRRLKRALEFGDLTLGLTAEQIDLVTAALEREISLRERGAAGISMQDALGLAGAVDDLVLLPPTVERTAEEFEEHLAAIEAAFAERSFDLDPLKAEIERNIGQLPDALSAVREALRDEENGIVEDFGEFFDNLQGALQAREEFARNIDLLRAMGFNELADAFQAAGLDSAAALADGISDPRALAEAEREIEEFNEQLAAFARADLERRLFDFLDDPFQIPINIEGILNSVNIPGIGRGLIENIQIPGGAGGGVPLPPSGSGGGGGSSLPLGNNITNNFYTAPQPTTDTERIKQALRSFN